MSTRVITERFCDLCLRAEKHVHATRTFIVSITEGTSGKPDPKELDTCDEHGEVVADLHKVVETAVRLDPTVSRWRATRDARTAIHVLKAATKQQPHLSPSQLPQECPICQDRLSSKGAVIGHIWAKHAAGKKRPATRKECADCQRKFDSPQAAQRHQTAVHGYDAMAEALAAAMAGAAT